MADIIVDTYKLSQYAQRISTVNSRIRSLDHRLDKLYSRVGLLDLFNLMHADILVSYSVRLARCQTYLQQTALDFEQAERDILKTDPAQFEGVSIGQIGGAIIATPGQSGSTSVPEKNRSWWDIIKDELAGIPEDIKSAGEALSWLEDQYGQLPGWFTVGVNVLVPDALQDAYTITSGLLQGDLTFEEGWDVVKNVLSENTTLAVICETLDYTFKTGMERSEEMDRQIAEQLAEGDIAGAVFDGAEGFIDTIIGGSIEVLGDVGGGAIDGAIDNIPIVKGLNMLTEYGTGLLGWNDGEGYSIGGLLGGATEKLAEGLDYATDVITDVTNVVTDAVTDGVKAGINWVKGWFD